LPARSRCVTLEQTEAMDEGGVVKKVVLDLVGLVV
jgi:hypothetical protein